MEENEELNEEKVPKMGTIAWHKHCINKISQTRKEVGKKGGIATAINNGTREPNYTDESEYSSLEERKNPPLHYKSRVDYDFLKFIRVAFKWALENNPTLTRSQIEMLLYLYNLGAFDAVQFNEYHKLIGIYQVKTLQQFEDEGYLKVWRAGGVKDGKKFAKLYALTQKGKTLCSKLHRICCGEEEISLNPLNNNMLRKDAPRINSYYLDIIKKMNSNVQNKEDGE